MDKNLNVAKEIKPLYFVMISQIFKDLIKTLNLSNNDFKNAVHRHKKSATNIWNIPKKKARFIYLNIPDGIPMKYFI